MVREYRPMLLNAGVHFEGQTKYQRNAQKNSHTKSLVFFFVISSFVVFYLTSHISNHKEEIFIRIGVNLL